MAEKLESDYKTFAAQIERKASADIEKIRSALDALKDAAAKVGEAAEHLS
jgi:outer membrane murein-binding lipoprotein Lpp